MYVRPISTFLSRGRSTPEIRAIDDQPCRCLCLGLRLQMTRVTPLRLTTLQCSQIGFTLVRTFTTNLFSTVGFGNSPVLRQTLTIAGASTYDKSARTLFMASSGVAAAVTALPRTM